MIIELNIKENKKESLKMVIDPEKLLNNLIEEFENEDLHYYGERVDSEFYFRTRLPEILKKSIPNFRLNSTTSIPLYVRRPR